MKDVYINEVVSESGTGFRDTGSQSPVPDPETLPLHKKTDL